MSVRPLRLMSHRYRKRSWWRSTSDAIENL